MLASFLEHVCMRVHPIINLGVVLKTCLETFAYCGVVINCHKNPDKPRHGCLSVRYDLLKCGLPCSNVPKPKS